MKALLTLILTVSSFCCFSQNSDSAIDTVSNLKLKYEFQKMKTYDSDLETYSKEIKAVSLIVIKIGQEGTGQLFINVREKMTFEILKCFYRDGVYSLALLNDTGHPLIATLFVKGNKASSFRVKNDSKNSELIFFD